VISSFADRLLCNLPRIILTHPLDVNHQINHAPPKIATSETFQPFKWDEKGQPNFGESMAMWFNMNIPPMPASNGK